MMKDYTILKAESAYELLQIVNAYLKQGYKLAGGVAVVSNGNLYKYTIMQAVYKEN